ncbi:hypothetical protein FQA39_LY09331 [Lamprigera yunnana]|nr:hypothetical protein FQA39_LY09331 [Lamprigera yunnana]
MHTRLLITNIKFTFLSFKHIVYSFHKDFLCVVILPRHTWTEEILNDDSKSADTGLPKEECSDSGRVVSHESDNNEESGSDIQACFLETENEHNAGPNQSSYYGKDKCKWSKNPPAPSHTHEPNNIRQKPGFISTAAPKKLNYCQIIICGCMFVCVQT